MNISFRECFLVGFTGFVVKKNKYSFQTHGNVQQLDRFRSTSDHTVFQEPEAATH